MAMHSRFTRIPKVHDLILAGIPTEAIPTYCALADYSNNINRPLLAPHGDPGQAALPEPQDHPKTFAPPRGAGPSGVCGAQ
jgi:hypothetical protein